MSIKEDKKEILQLYEQLILNYYKNSKSKDLTSDYLEKIKLTDADYKQLKSILTKEKNYKIYTTEAERIINILKKQLVNPKIEYDNEEIDPTIYFHVKKNKTYLINFDSIENKWYLSLLETSSFNLIKEIYNNTYNNFINYLKIHFN